MSATGQKEGGSSMTVVIGSCVELASNNLSKGALDWAVAQAEGIEVIFSSNGTVWLQDKPNQMYSPSTRYRQGGQFLDKYDVQLSTDTVTGKRIANINGFVGRGHDTLSATCLAVVLQKFGPSVQFPSKLAEIFLRSSEASCPV